MTLFKQIALVMSILVIVLLGVTMVSNYESSSKFIRDQLYSNAKNTASSLGLALSKAVESNDMAMAETMINAVFDSGYYEAIVLTDMDGNIVYERRAPLRIKGVPEWFVRRVKLESVEADVPVGREWRLTGYLKVKGHRGHAYEELWTAFQEVVAGFLLLSLVALAAVYLLLRVVLRSLDRVREQAEAVVGNRFVIQEQLPKTTEFRKVVQAMNAMVVKVKDIYRREAKAVARYNELLYKDKETGFYNRNYFRLKLKSYLSAKDRFSHGFIVAIQVDDYHGLYKKLGANGVHELVVGIRSVLTTHTLDVPDAMVCRTRDEDFMIVLPGVHKTEALRVGHRIAEECIRYKYPANVAVITYHANDTLSSVLSAVDSALMHTATREGHDVYYYARDAVEIPNLGHDEWIARIEEAMVHHRFVPFFQPLKDPKGNVVQEEVLLRLKYNGKTYAAGEFMPIVSGVGMQEKLDRYVIEEVMKREDVGSVAFNLSYEFIEHTANLEWLEHIAAEWKTREAEISFEVANGAIGKDDEAVKAFASFARRHGWLFGIDHFTVGLYDLEELQEIRPDYLKINASYLLSLLEEGEDKGRVSSFKIITSLLDIRLVATGVDNADAARRLREHDVEWLQGYIIAEPYRKERG